MSNFILTNNLEKFERGVSNFRSRDLIESSQKRMDGVFFASFHKRGYLNENFVSLDNDDFVCSIGTFVYKSLRGKVALLKLYEDFDGNYELVQKTSVLQGTLIVKKGNVIKIFCDKYNIHWTYYFSERGVFYISSSLSNTVRSLDNKVLRLDSLMEAIIQRGTIGKMMFYNGIKRLFGNEIISITDNGNFHLDSYKYNPKEYDFSQATKHEVMSTFSDAFLEMIENLYGAFGSDIAIHQSGGLDSRLILASFLKLGYKPNLLYGVGNSPLTSQYNADRKLVDRISKTYGLKTYFMNWGYDRILNNDDITGSFKKYGFNCNENFCNSNWYREYTENVGGYAKLILDGHMGETLNIEMEESIFNGNYPIKFDREYIFNEYQKIFFNNFSWKSEARRNDHIAYLKSETYEIMSNTFYLEHNNGLMEIDAYQKFWWIRYRPADAHPSNLHNDFYSSLSPLGNSKLHDITLNIPFKLIKNRAFSIETIDNWVPGLNSVGLFSRATFSKIQDGKIIRSGGRYNEILSKVNNRTPKPVLTTYRSLKGVLTKINQKPTNDPIRNYLILELDKTELGSIFDFSKYNGDVRMLATTLIYWKGIEELGYDSIV